MYRVVGLASALAIFLPVAAAQAAPADYAVMSVDAGRSAGLLKPLRGVSGAPDMTFAGDALKAGFIKRPADLSAAYRDARVNLVRTHDSLGAADVDRVDGPLPPLPGPTMGERGHNEFVLFPDLSADPADPKSYNFGPTDRLIAGIRAIDADVIFRLGRGSGTTAEPPKDLAKYGEIIRHIVLHYNKGWAGGFQGRVRYWEVWNEPDLGLIWWRGTPEQYYGLYGAAAKAVKAADPKALVGGPTIALVNQSQPYREGFLAYARDHRLPLDFFSWHYYSDANDPQDFPAIGREMQRLLDRYGFKTTINSLDEWNASLPSMMGGPSTGQAAFVASARIYMQDSPIGQEVYYRADGQFGADGKHPNKIGQALIALGRMADTPVRLAGAGGDLKGLAMQAGRSNDGKTVQVLISNYEIPPADRGPRKGPDLLKIPNLFEMALPPRRAVTYDHNRGYDLTIKGLSAKGSYVVERYRISETNDFALLDQSRASGPAVHVTSALPPPAVELVVVRQAPR